MAAFGSLPIIVPPFKIPVGGFLQSDVQFKLVRDMQTNIKKIVNLDDLVACHKKHKIIQQV
ncbi:putative signal recognition particle, SRP54 subunit [Helianthus anomalus]